MKKKELSDMSLDELNELSMEVKHLILEKSDALIKKKIEDRKSYIGKCFVRAPRDAFSVASRYCRVLKAMGEDISDVSVLVFTNPPECSFDKKVHLMRHMGDNLLGRLSYEGIRVESISFRRLEDERYYKEISEEEFNSAMDSHVNTLKSMDWWSRLE